MTEQLILTVTQLNQQVYHLLEQSFPHLAIKGEISNLVRASSGHWYFSLKDAGAQVRCAMFRGKNLKVRTRIDNGMQVLVTGKISLYQPRGDYQLIVESMEELGVGQLQRDYEQLKVKLQKAGLFNPEHKQPLPQHPRQIGVITSATGAALRDILRVLKRRMPSIPVIIYPSLVQGDLAAKQLVQQIQVANQRQECDVLILARGGGSLEDLWPFNEECLAHAIFASKLPIISGVGHEIDFTIADFVADQRAATPSAAAELVSPDQLELQQTLDHWQLRLQRLLKQQLNQATDRLTWLEKRLRQAHPQQQINQQARQLKQLSSRLSLAMQACLQEKHYQLTQQQHQLQASSPIDQLQQQRQRLALLKQQLINLSKQQLERHQHQLNQLAQALHLTSPLATLGRGYAIVSNKQTGKVIRQPEQIAPGEQVLTKLELFELTCTVDVIKERL